MIIILSYCENKMSELQQVLRQEGVEDERNYNYINYNPKYTLNIPIENLGNVYASYIAELEDGSDELFLAERVDSIIPPVAVNLNFRFNTEALGDNEAYPNLFIYTIIYCYQQAIREKLVVSEDNKELICCYLENSLQENNEGTVTFITVRLQFPYCKVDSKFQEQVLRKTTISLIYKHNPLAKAFVQPLGSWEEIIENNTSSKPFLLYGSRVNVESSPFRFISILEEINKSVLSQDIDDFKEDIPERTIEQTFSLSNNGYIHKGVISEREYKDRDPEDLLPFYLSPRYYAGVTHKKVNRASSPKGETKQIFEIKDDRFDIAQTLVQMLGKHRFTSKIFWKDVGICFYNITKGSTAGFSAWMAISIKRNCEFAKDEEDCRDVYDDFRFCNKPYNEQTIAWMAKEDNYQNYKSWHDKWIEEGLYEIFKAPKVLDLDFAQVIWRCFWLTIVCYDVEKKGFCEFKDHRWKKSQRGIKLKKLIPKVIGKKLNDLRAKLANNMRTSQDENFKTKGETTLKKIGQMIMNMKTERHINTYIKSAMQFFYDSEFMKVVNKNPCLTGCTNGVIEVLDDEAIFRPGKPQDYITMTTGVAYPEHYTQDSKRIKESHLWLRKTLIIPELVHWFKKFMSSFLKGGNNDKIVPFCCGAGGDNSKSMFSKWFSASLGDYCILGDPSVFYGRTGRSSGPNDGLARMEDARVVLLNENDTDVKMPSGTIKMVSGGDGFYAAKKHKDGKDIKASAVPIFWTNSVPQFENPDGPLRKRVTVVPFESKFAEGYPHSLEEQFRQRHFKPDRMFEQRIPRLAGSFLWICVNYWKAYITEGLTQPECVLSVTKKYWENNDPYLQYVKECLEAVFCAGSQPGEKVLDVNSKLTLSQIYSNFKPWYKNTFPGEKRIPSQNMLRKQLQVHLGESNTSIWNGVKLRESTVEGSLIIR